MSEVQAAQSPGVPVIQSRISIFFISLSCREAEHPRGGPSLPHGATLGRGEGGDSPGSGGQQATPLHPTEVSGVSGGRGVCLQDG